MTPYEILGVDPHSDDKAIRKAYLELLKQFPPDRSPDRFKEISGAYEEIKDEKKRLKNYLFDKKTPVDRPMDALLLEMRRNAERKPPSFEQLKELLRNAE